MQNKVITIQENEDFLRQVSTSVSLDDKELKSDIEKLENYCKGNEVMALASIQLGIPKRLVYLKNTNLDIIEKQQTDTASLEDNTYNESIVLINPVILKKIGLTTYWEACASCMDYVGLVERPYKMLVSYSTLDGEKKEETFEGFEATVLSHEIDHLEGILHIDIALQFMKMPLEERKKLRQREPYTILSTTQDYEELKTKKENT